MSDAAQDGEVRLMPGTHQYVEIATGRVIPSVTSVLKAARVIDPPYGTAGAAQGDAVRAEHMRRGLERGSAVHRMSRSLDETGSLEDALYHDVFDPADVTIENINYVSAYNQFLTTSGYRPLAWEAVVHSRSANYAGRVDGVGWLGHERILLDRKTGSAVHRSAWLQMTAYKIAWDEMHPTERIDDTYAVLLRADQTFRLLRNPLGAATAESFWMAALWLARWHQMAV